MKKHIVIPSLLLAYMAVMSYIAYPAYVQGEISAHYYYGVIGVNLVIIIFLFNLIRAREEKHKK